MSKAQLLGRFSEAHDDLLIAADMAVTRGEAGENGWGLREILGHVAAWEAEGITRIPQLADGAPDMEYDETAFNAGAAAAVAGLTLVQVRDGLKDTHERLVSVLDALDESAFVEAGAAHEWIVALIDHGVEHAHELNGSR